MVSKLDLDLFEEPLRKLQIVSVAMGLGAVALLAVMAWLTGSHPPEPLEQGRLPLVSLVAAGYGVLAILLSFVLPDQLISRNKQRIKEGSFEDRGSGLAAVMGDAIEKTGNTGRLFVLYQTRSLLTVVFLEGGSLFASVAYRVEGQVYLLVIAAVLILLLFLRLPTRRGMAEWIEDQEKELRRG